MDDLIRQGLVLYWGTSEWDPDQLVEAHRLCTENGLHPPQVEQPQYSMLYRERVENEIIPVAVPRGIGIVAWSPLAMGMLTGKYDDGIPDDSRFAVEPWSKGDYITEANIQRVGRLKAVADLQGVSRAQLALAWLLRQDAISSVITGATSVAQLRENVNAADVVLSDEVLAEVDAALALDA
jgi:aryl-alcohol dehydrogenase-like predicted oxidoreductase